MSSDPRADHYVGTGGEWTPEDSGRTQCAACDERIRSALDDYCASCTMAANAGDAE